jgi:hypothetical protein
VNMDIQWELLKILWKVTTMVHISMLWRSFTYRRRPRKAVRRAKNIQCAQFNLRRHHTKYNSSLTKTNHMTSLSTPLTRKVKGFLPVFMRVTSTCLFLCKYQNIFQSCNMLIRVYTHITLNMQNKLQSLHKSFVFTVTQLS